MNLTGGVSARIERPVYGGDGLAHLPDGQVVLLPFVLPGELVQITHTAASTPVVLEPSTHRTAPACVHFGVCGGCHYQMATYEEQLRIKASVLGRTLARSTEVPADEFSLPPLQSLASPEPFGYRSRIRLRVREIEGTLRLGYSLRGTRDFLPITMCPIAAPVLWHTAAAMMAVAIEDATAQAWFRAASEIELATNEAGARVQVHLLCPGEVPRTRGGLAPVAAALRAAGVPLAGMGASRLHVASGRAMQVLAAEGAAGLVCRVGPDTFWLERGGFFQVNRFLLPGMVDLVTFGRTGTVAWDLYAGVGLFSRALTRSFGGVTAVEANPLAMPELRRGLQRPADTVVQGTTLSFLQAAVLQRERPDLVVLDPPRAGAGEEVCALLNRIAPAELVYVSCDPTTLARDLRALCGRYDVRKLDMIDLFPQTFHLETVMVLHRKDLAG